MIEKVAANNRNTRFKWFWLSAGDQMDLERQLNLGFGFPAFLVISPEKQLMATLKLAFTEDNIDSFVKSILSGGADL